MDETLGDYFRACPCKCVPATLPMVDLADVELEIRIAEDSRMEDRIRLEPHFPSRPALRFRNYEDERAERQSRVPSGAQRAHAQLAIQLRLAEQAALLPHQNDLSIVLPPVPL